MTRVKICCHSCKATGHVTEKSYPSGEAIKVVCYECNGEKWVYANVEE